MRSATGALTFVRFFVRRDRWMVLCWVVGGVVLYWSQAVSVDGLYATQAEFDRAAQSMASNPGFVAMAGPARVLNTTGGQVAWQASAFGAVVAGLMSMFLVGRHTRSEEESGREELVRAGAVGRTATVTATVVVVALANAVLGGGIALSLVAYGLPVAGSVSLGVAAALAGLVFGAVALVAAQLTEGTRSMYGLVGVVIGAAYVLRAAGDVAENGLSWLSPIGWGQAMRAYAGETWWPAALSVGAAGMLAAAALWLLDRRDLGTGVLPVRRGPAEGRLSAVGLAWRLQRGPVIGWTLGLLLVGAAYGSIGDDVESVLGDSEFSQSLLAAGGGSVTDAFYATAVSLLALMAAAFAISSALRPRGEEAAGRTETLLSTGLSRRRWAAGHTVMTVVGVVAVLAAGGAGTGLVYGLVAGDVSQVARLTGSAVAYAPAVLVLSALTRLLYGFSARAALGGWAGLVFCAVVMLFGDLWRLPGWLTGLSPFAQLPAVPVDTFQWWPWLLVSAVAAVLSATGQVLLERRDMR